MPLEKGRKKTGGRQKGTPNKVTKGLRDFVKQMLDDNKALVYEDFRALDPKERLTMFERLLQYVIPKQNNIQNIDYNNLSEEQLDDIISNIKDNGDEE